MRKNLKRWFCLVLGVLGAVHEGCGFLECGGLRVGRFGIISHRKFSLALEALKCESGNNE